MWNATILFIPLLILLLSANTNYLFAASKLEDAGQVSFYMKSGRIMKSEVLKEHSDTITILYNGEEMVIRKDAVQFALDSSGGEVPIDAQAADPAGATGEKAKEAPPADELEKPSAKSGADGLSAGKELGGLDADLDAGAEPAGEESRLQDVPVDGVTKVLVRIANGSIYEGVIIKENRKYYYLLDSAGKKEHKLRKKDVVDVEKSLEDGDASAAAGKKIDFYMKDKTTIKGLVVEEKPASYIIDSEGKKQELQKKDITFALDEEGKDFTVKIDPFLLKKIEDAETAKKESDLKKKREAEQKRANESRVIQQVKKQQADKEDNYSLGLKYFEDKNYKSAISHFERAVSADPKFAEAYYRLAFAYYSIGEEDLAWKNIEKSKELGKKEAQTLINILQKDKEHTLKKEKLKKLLAWSGAGLGAAVILVFGFIMIFGKKDDSLDGIELTLNNSEIKPSADTAGQIQSSFENTKITQAGYVEPQPPPAEATVNVLEDPAIVAPVFQESPKTLQPQFNPEQAEKSYLKANELVSRGNLLEAKSEYETAIKFNPRFDLAYIGLGYVLLSQGKIRESIEQYTKCLNINSNMAEAHYSLGIAYFNMGDISQARYEWKKTLLIDPNFSQAKECLESAK